MLDCRVGNGAKVAVIEIYLEKAFDRVRHDVLFNLLAYVDFGKIIMHGIKMAYRNCTTRLLINRNLIALMSFLPSVGGVLRILRKNL